MEYGVSFIRNLQKIKDTSNNQSISFTIKEYERDGASGVKVTHTYNIQTDLFPNLITKYRIYPGLVANYKKKYYSVLDRNLQEDKTYKDDATIEVNANGLSFNGIKYFNSEDYYSEYYSYNYGIYYRATNASGTYLNKFPVLSEATYNGVIYDVFKLPWNVNVFNHPKYGSKYIKSQYFAYNSDTDSSYDVLFHPGLSNITKIINQNALCYNGFATISGSAKTVQTIFLLLGIGIGADVATSITEKYSAIFTCWNKWINIIRILPSSGYEIQAKQIYDKCNTFEQFVNLVISKWDDDTSQSENKIIDLTDIFASAGILYFNVKEIDCIKACKRYTSDKLNIVDSSGTTVERKQKLKYLNNYYDIHLLNDKNVEIESLGSFNYNDELFIFNNKSVEKVYISNFGDIAEQNLKSDEKIANATVCNIDLEAKTYKVYSVLYEPYSLCSNFETYDVAIRAKSINYDVISVINNNKLYTYRKLELGNNLEIPIYQLDRVSPIGQNSDKISEQLDALLETEEYITPSEYYNNFTNIGAYSDGDDGFVRVKTDSNETGVPSWFWSDTLKNWCTYKNVTLRNTIKLYVWNGKNGWDEFEDILRRPDDYLYDITYLKLGIDFSTTYKYQNLNIVYKSVILTYDNNFSQYTNDTFQTVRIGKMWSKGLGNDTRRYPFSIGMPPVMRLASGEIALMYSLTLPGVNKDHPLIYPEHVKFINDVCKKYFTAGDDKTMKDDWKRVEKLKVEQDSASVIASMNESTLVDADEINTVEDKALTTAMTFVPFKQYIETDNLDTESYVERWS